MLCTSVSVLSAAPPLPPAVNVGDYVVVVNAKQISLSGRKWEQKVYRHHTMYPGGLKEVIAKDLLEKKPTDV